MLLKPVKEETEKVHLTVKCCQLKVNKDDYGFGTLVISEKNIAWITDEHIGMELNYEKINMHSTCEDKVEPTKECVMLMCSPHEDSVQQVVEDNDGGYDVCDVESSFVYFTPSKSSQEKLRKILVFFNTECHSQEQLMIYLK